MPDIYAESNQLLEFLAENCDPDWINLYVDVLSPAELDSNIDNVQKALKKYNLAKPVGAVLGGTGALKKAAGIQSQEAVQILKTQGRIIQAGKGRGKAICVLNSAPLDGFTFDTSTDNAEVQVSKSEQNHTNCVPADNIPELISALALASFEQDKRIKEINKQLALTLVKHDELQAVLKQRTKEYDEVRAELDKLQNTITTSVTWS